MNEEVEIRIFEPDFGFTASYDAIQLSEFQYLLKCNSPLSEELTYGTIIEVEKEKTKEGDLILSKIVKKSDFSSETYMLPGDLNETELSIVGDMIINAGGYWEVLFGGMGFVNLPKDSTLDISSELRKLSRLKRGINMKLENCKQK